MKGLASKGIVVPHWLREVKQEKLVSNESLKVTVTPEKNYGADGLSYSSSDSLSHRTFYLFTSPSVRLSPCPFAVLFHKDDYLNHGVISISVPKHHPYPLKFLFVKNWSKICKPNYSIA